MRIIKLSDGLGNQMFQYSFGMAIAYLNNEPVKFDTSWFNASSSAFTQRQFKLTDYNIIIDIASKDEINKIIDPPYITPFRQMFWRIEKYKPYFKRRFIKEKQSNFDSNIYSCSSKRRYYSGFWQSPLYFKEIHETLIKDFTLKVESENFKCYLKNIQGNSESIGIHIRRGDYAKKDSEHILLPKEYYEQGIQSFELIFPNLQFFFFTDDKDYVIKEFQIKDYPNRFLIEHTSEAEDQVLLSKCNHQIISNSTFSWWAAYLNPSPRKKVLYPKNWFYNKLTNQELFIDGWEGI